MYHYESCGLPNVWLKNGYKEHDTPYGKGVSIEDVEGLHRAITKSVIKSPNKMTGAEVRFLRKEMDLSQKRLGEMLGVSDQTVALWEKQEPTSLASRFIKVLATAHFGCQEIRELIEQLAELDRIEHEELYFEESESGWLTSEAA